VELKALSVPGDASAVDPPKRKPSASTKPTSALVVYVFGIIATLVGLVMTVLLVRALAD
jgi:hypothetical protein